MKKNIESIKLEKLVSHPHNRGFDKTGSQWEDFTESVRIHGVIEPLTVRPWGKLKGVYQMLSGHRRCQAAQDVGLVEVPCQVMPMDDKEALVFLVNSNLQRENPNLVEEARLVQALETELGMDKEEICERLCRDQAWVVTRQMVFSFGEDVVAALSSKDESKRLSEGAFREVLRAPEALREKALEMVLSGEDGDEPLSEQRAREYIQFSLIPDWEDEMKWEAGADKLKKDVARDLKKFCDGKKPEMIISVMGWGKGADGVLDLVDAKEWVPVERLVDAVKDQRAWVWYAEKIGVPVYVLPPDKAHREKRVVVSRRQIMDDAAARHESGMEWDILPKGVKQPAPAVTSALHALEGQGEADFDEDGPVLPVATQGGKDGIKIEQVMEHHAMINMGKVRMVAMWAIDSKSDPLDAPDFVPKWATKLAIEGLWTDIDEVCNWVMELKGGGK